jgi:hypothetical protein
MFLGLPDPDSLVRSADPDPAPDPSLFIINVLSGLMPDKIEFQQKILAKKYIFKTEDDVPVGKLQEKI